MTIEDLIGTEGIEVLLREELETAWLRGWVRGQSLETPGGMRSEAAREAADYAERVVGGLTRPERPEWMPSANEKRSYAAI